MASSALGTAFGGPAGGFAGNLAGSQATKLFGLELEGMSYEDQEFEVAKRFVRMARRLAYSNKTCLFNNWATIPKLLWAYIFKHTGVGMARTRPVGKS
ncbi:MAG: hypothetical protein IPH12_00025 [Saprospirales bacterium]|jgi:hypothetical protein|nr:hypothetical protein [Saprospirales bacterium]